MKWNNAISDFQTYLNIERGLSENSVTCYVMDIHALHDFISKNNIEVSPIDCDSNTVQQFIYEQAKILSPQSQARRLSGLKSFFNYLIFESYRKNNPIDLIAAPKIGKKLPDTLNIEEIETLLAHIDLSHPQGHRNRAIIETLYGSGLRVSELVQLSLSNIFFKEKLMRIKGKGDKQRLVPIGDYTEKYLKIYINESRPLQKINTKSQDIVFLNRNGNQLTRTMVFTMVKQLGIKANIQKQISPHTFRHSFATHLLKNGADLRAIQLLMGHESITTTEIYTHLDTKHLRNVLEHFHPRN